MPSHKPSSQNYLSPTHPITQAPVHDITQAQFMKLLTPTLPVIHGIILPQLMPSVIPGLWDSSSLNSCHHLGPSSWNSSSPTHIIIHGITHPLTHAIIHAPTHAISHPQLISLLIFQFVPSVIPNSWNSPPLSPDLSLCHYLSPVYTITQAPTHRIIHSPAYVITHSLTHVITHPPAHLLAQTITHSPTYGITHPRFVPSLME